MKQLVFNQVKEQIKKYFYFTSTMVIVLYFYLYSYFIGLDYIFENNFSFMSVVAPIFPLILLVDMLKFNEEKEKKDFYFFAGYLVLIFAGFLFFTISSGNSVFLLFLIVPFYSLTVTILLYSVRNVFFTQDNKKEDIKKNIFPFLFLIMVATFATFCFNKVCFDETKNYQ